MEYVEIEALIKQNLAKLLSIDASTISDTKTFDKYGFDSTAIVGLSGALSEELEIELEANVAYDYPNVKLLAEVVHKKYLDAK